MAFRDISRGVQGRNLIALTFDDGPAFPEATSEIISILQHYGARATFFVRGCMAVTHAETLRMIHTSGMEIGNHTFNHSNLGLLGESGDSEEYIADELIRTHEVVMDLMGFAMTLFRPPWGSLSKQVYRVMDSGTLRQYGYDRILWTLGSGDTDAVHDADTIFRRITTSTELDGGIVLLHDGADRYYSERCGSTVTAMRRVVPWLLENGYHLVTVSDIIAGLD